MTPKYEGPRLARPWETKQLLRLINRVFSDGVPLGIEREYPHLYSAMKDELERYHVITHQGRIVAHVGVHPLEFVAGSRRILAGGIHAVGTDKRHRGKGLMSKLLVHCSKWMREHGMPLSILWGDAVRYGRFGWKVAGTQAVIGLSRRSLPALAGYRRRVVRTDPDEAVLDGLYSLHKRLPHRVARSRKEFGLVTRKPYRRIYTVRSGKRFAAYCMVLTHGKGRRRRYFQIEDWAGSGHAVLSILDFLLRAAPEASLEIRLPTVWLNWWNDLLKGADSWSLRVAPLGQIKVVDRDAVLKALGITEFGGILKRAGGPGGKDLAPLLFGPLPPSAHFPPAIARKIGASLPVPLFLYPADHI